MIRRTPRSTLFPTRRSSDLIVTAVPTPTPDCVPGQSQLTVIDGLIQQGKWEQAVKTADDALGTRNLCVDAVRPRSEEHTSELQSHVNLVCRLLLEKKNK